MGGGEKTDWVGKEWARLFFLRGKNGPAHSFPGEKTDWGEIPACYNSSFEHPKHMFKLMDKNIIAILRLIFLLNWPYDLYRSM